MRQRLPFFIAAALFFVTAALSTFNDGGTAQTGAGVAIGCAMLVLGFKMRKAGR